MGLKWFKRQKTYSYLLKQKLFETKIQIRCCCDWQWPRRPCFCCDSCKRRLQGLCVGKKSTIWWQPSNLCKRQIHIRYRSSLHWQFKQRTKSLPIFQLFRDYGRLGLKKNG